MAAKQIIFNTIKAAQEREEQEQEREAFQSYLRAVQLLVDQLQQASPRVSSSGCGLPPTRLFVLASSCLESAQSLFDRASTEHRDFKLAQIATSSSPSLSTCPSTSRSMPATSQRPPSQYPNSPRHQPQRMHSDTTVGSTTNTLTPPAPRHHSMNSPHPPFKRRPQVSRRTNPNQHPQYSVQPLHRISPMDEAKRKNMYLMQQYKASLRRDSLRMLGESRQNMTLNYLRRMEENRSVARINEQNIARKAKEREARLRQENQKVKMTQFRKSMDSLSLEELSQEVTSFDQGKKEIMLAKQRLSASPQSANLASGLLNEILSCADHPMCKLLVECQFSVVQFLQPLVRKIESCGKLPNVAVTTDKTGSPLCTVAGESTVTSDSNHNIPTASRDGSTNSPQNTIDSNDSKGSDSLDRKLEALRNELMRGTDENEGKESKSPESVFNESEEKQNETSNDAVGVVENSSEEDDDDFTTLPCLNDCLEKNNMNDGTLSPMNDDALSPESEDVLMSLKEASFEMPDGAPIVPDQEQVTVVFRGLLPVVCTPHYGNFEKVSKECSEYLSGAVKLLHSGIDKLVESFVVIYPDLATQDNCSECRDIIESNFFPALTPLLLPVYRCTNYSTECKITQNMVKHCNDTPKEVGVRRKFWLENQDAAPYCTAIETLHQLCNRQTPLAKLECLVTFSKSIIQSIEEYYSFIDPETTERVDTGVGVDDILPIMTYIIIKAALPQLISECSFMQEFIQECYSMGEEGFCLTSFDTAVKFVSLMNS